MRAAGRRYRLRPLCALALAQVSRNSLGNLTPRKKTRFRKFPGKFDPSDEKVEAPFLCRSTEESRFPSDDLLASPMHRRDPPKALKNTCPDHFLDNGAAHTKSPTALTGSKTFSDGYDRFATTSH